MTPTDASPARSDLGPIEQLVLQPTPFCNLDCRYCYLPNRSDSSRMHPDTAFKAVTTFVTSRYAAERVECRWHAGEPLAVPAAYYRGIFERLRSDSTVGSRVWHSLQTNGTLVDDEWCDLFAEFEVGVGVSIDGPRELNDANRVTRGGEGTFNRIMRGIGTLARRRIPFDVIAVLTERSLAASQELYEFFAGLGARRVGFNVEESEGGHTSAAFSSAAFFERYRTFLSDILRLQRDGRVQVRELWEMERVVRFGSAARRSLMAHPFSIVSVDWRGDVSSFSPELLGQDDLRYNHFRIGNVLTDTVDSIAEACARSAMARDIRRGVEDCARSCRYFFLCGGGAPANKLYENGTFNSTTTGYCKARIQIPADLVIDAVEDK